MIRRILVVDDTVFFRSLVREMLAPQGYEILEAESGARAIALYETHRPDFVLMDFNMPEMDGLAAARAIFQKEPKARIALCTGIQTEALRARARQMPFCDLLLKPLKAETLLALIQNLDRTEWSPPGTDAPPAGGGSGGRS